MTTNTITTTPETVTIPLNKLVPSKANVRRTGAKDGIAELAASIAAHGLRQNLNVRHVEGGDTFEVVAGARRLAAMKRLVKDKRLPKDAPVRCLIIDSAEDAQEISLVENVQRLAMHPDDQFAAFQALIDRGSTVEEVAARFGVTPNVVARRLKLAAVSPKLRALYRKGELTLDHMMAFAVSDEQAEQERIWKELPQWNRDPEDIRAALTGEALRGDHATVRFVGMEAYVAAGGAVLRDLFDEENGGYVTDRVLLFRLAAERLEAVAATVKAEGWKWAKVELERDYSTSYRYVYPILGEDDAEDAPETYAPEDMARAGAILRIGRDGTVEVRRGVIHPDDVERDEAASDSAGAAPKKKAEAGDLSAVLVADVSAHRTAALRLELSRNSHVALASVVHAMALPLIYGELGIASTCLAVRASSETLDRHVEVVEDCTAHAELAKEAERWGDHLPGNAADLFGWCLAQPQDVLLDLLAFLAAQSVNAVETKHDHTKTARLDHANDLAEALSFDMARHWTPSVEGFYGRVSKATLLHIVTETRAPMQVSISELKKKDAARYVAKAMQGITWLPAPFRMTGTEAVAQAA
jgi:ParB family chromosome partitioning protein